MSLLRTVRGGKSVEFSLANGGVLLGTAPGCQIVVADPAAAPKHCKIVRSPQGFVVTDLTGVGKTLINGTKIREHVLRKGDVLQIGSEKFTFEEAAEPVAAGVKSAPAPAAPAAAAPSTGSGQGPRRRLPSRPPAPAATPAKPTPAAKPGAAPRKLTAKPGSVARVHKGHETFALPSTTKGRVIALSVAIGLVVLGGILFVISSGTKNSEQIKKAAEADIERLNKIPETDLQARYQLVQEILSNPDYDKYAKQVINSLHRLKNSLGAAIDVEKKADQDLKPLLARYKELKEGSADEYDKQAEGIWEKLDVYWNHYKDTSYKTRLEEVRTELKDFLEKRGTKDWKVVIAKLKNDVQKLISDNNFSAGWMQVEKFGQEYGEKNSLQLKAQLDDVRNNLKTSASRHLDTLKTQAAGKTTKEESRRTLEAARPFILGIPDLEKTLEKYLGEFK